jgi:hypothetical protein
MPRTTCSRPGTGGSTAGRMSLPCRQRVGGRARLSRSGEHWAAMTRGSGVCARSATRPSLTRRRPPVPECELCRGHGWTVHLRGDGLPLRARPCALAPAPGALATAMGYDVEAIDDVHLALALATGIGAGCRRQHGCWPRTAARRAPGPGAPRLPGPAPAGRRAEGGQGAATERSGLISGAVCPSTAMAVSNSPSPGPRPTAHCGVEWGLRRTMCGASSRSLGPCRAAHARGT